MPSLSDAKIKEAAALFLQLMGRLKKRKYHQKFIAPRLGIVEGQLSNLLKLLLKIVKSKNSDYASIFRKANANITVKVLGNLEDYNAILKQILSLPERAYLPSYAEVWKGSISNAIEKAVKIVKEKELEGVYAAWSHSSTFPRIVKLMVLIKQNEFDGSVDVVYKPKGSNFASTGTLFFSNNNILVVCIVHQPETLEEPAFMHFLEPYKRKPEILRGILLNHSQRWHPRAARIIFKRVGDVIPEEEFNERYRDEPVEYPYSSVEGAIREYLQDRIESTIKVYDLEETQGTLKDVIYEQKLIQKDIIEANIIRKDNQRNKTLESKQSNHSVNGWIQGYWLVDFYSENRHVIELQHFFVKHNGEIDMKYQHFKKGARYKYRKGGGKGDLKGDMLSMFYFTKEEASIPSNGVFVLKAVKSVQADIKLVGRYYEVYGNNIRTSQNGKVEFRRVDEKVTDEIEQKLVIEEEACFENYEAIAEHFGIKEKGIDLNNLGDGIAETGLEDVL